MRNKIANYVSTWKRRGYPDDLPDEAPQYLETECKAPSYRAICRAILKNDVAMVGLGFSKEKTQSYMDLKRIELDERSRSGAAKNR